MFRGVATALITPFTDSGVDYEAFGRLIDYQIENGVDALLVLGTTGEPATMTSDEKDSVMRFALNKINKRVPVIIGTGSNCTATAVSQSVAAERLGADALLVVTPYYNKCTQNAIVAHYQAISDAVNIPVIAYNVPGRTGVNILPQTYDKLAKIKNVTATKEACGNVAQIAQAANIIKDTDMILYSGDDGLILPMLALGAKGLISVASNAFPKEISQMVHLYLDGKISESQKMYFDLLDIMNGLFVEVNPIPVKYACSLLGLCQNVLRMPLTSIEEANAEKVKTLMINAGLYKEV